MWQKKYKYMYIKFRAYTVNICQYKIWGRDDLNKEHNVYHITHNKEPRTGISG